jgi:thiol-disulfide isomerase/thioredoxin
MKILLLNILFLILTITNTGCQEIKNEIGSEVQKNRDSIIVLNASAANKAPDFTLPLSNGGELKLSEYKGKIVVLDFWATWCGPCRKGIPDLIEIQKKYKDKVAIIGISLDTDTKSDVVPFIKRYGINYPVVYGNSEVVRAYGNIQAIPTSFIVDQNGDVVDTHVGLVDKSVYISKIELLLKKS